MLMMIASRIISTNITPVFINSILIIIGTFYYRSALSITIGFCLATDPDYKLSTTDMFKINSHVCYLYLCFAGLNENKQLLSVVYLGVLSIINYDIWSINKGI